MHLILFMFVEQLKAVSSCRLKSESVDLTQREGELGAIEREGSLPAIHERGG